MFDRRVGELERELAPLDASPSLVLDPGAAAILTDSPQAWQLPLADSADVSDAFRQLLSHHLEAKYRPLVMLWSDGSAVVEPCCLVVKGLPGPDFYPALLDGSWANHRWRSVPGVVSQDTLPGTLLVDEAGPVNFRSAAATDMGRVRGNNEDGFVDRPEAGLWAVADGMGGHSHGEVASQMVCDALADFPLDGTFEEAIDAARLRLQQVNDHLVQDAQRRTPSDRSGSTVVMLLLRGARLAVLWAGDSRAYRWRDGTLEQLTVDHSLAELAGPNAAESSIITRAVGIEPDLAAGRPPRRPSSDDRFLLCSDGLTRVLPEAEISTWMGAPDHPGRRRRVDQGHARRRRPGQRDGAHRRSVPVGAAIATPFSGIECARVPHAGNRGTTRLRDECSVGGPGAAGADFCRAAVRRRIWRTRQSCRPSTPSACSARPAHRKRRPTSKATRKSSPRRSPRSSGARFAAMPSTA